MKLWANIFAHGIAQLEKAFRMLYVPHRDCQFSLNLILLAQAACDAVLRLSVQWYRFQSSYRMVADFPDEIVARIVPFLVDYRDFRQLLWLCRSGGSILAQVQSLDIQGVYSRNGSDGNPFEYHHFQALRRVSVTLRFCLFHVYCDFVHFTGVTELNIHLAQGNIPRMRNLMYWLEHELSEGVRHVGVHVMRWDLRSLQQRDMLAMHILMLSNHHELDTFAVSIAGVGYTLEWARPYLFRWTLRGMQMRMQ
jgi:hypothetical protein